MSNIDQNSLVSRGWACGDRYIYIVHSLETNRAGPGAGPIVRQIMVLSEHNLFTLKGK